MVPRSFRYGVVAAGLGLLGASACGPPSLEQVLESEIREAVLSAGYSFDSIEMERYLSTGTEASQIPGASYDWALFPLSDHLWVSALAGQRDSQVHVIRNPEDWSHFAGEWRPSSPEEAVAACSELVRYAGPRSDPFNFPIPVPPAPPETARIWWPSSTIDSVVATLETASARLVAEAWVVDLWVMEMARTARYACTLEMRTEGLRPDLLVVDSLSIGLFADEH